jgi:hypothetical protein
MDTQDDRGLSRLGMHLITSALVALGPEGVLIKLGRAACLYKAALVRALRWDTAFCGQCAFGSPPVVGKVMSMFLSSTV